MIFKKLAMALVATLFLSAALPAHAAPTWVGTSIGFANIQVNNGMETDMKAAGVPDLCRREANQLLSKYIFYGFHDNQQSQARVQILCHFEASSTVRGETGIKNEKGRSLGTRGRDLGLKYIHFKNSKGRDVERFIFRRVNNDILECTRDQVCIRLADGGRNTVVDTTRGPIKTIYHNGESFGEPGLPSVRERRSDIENKGGVFAFMRPAMTSYNSNILKVGLTDLTGGSGRVSSTFGKRTSPGGVGSTNHKGCDIATACGTPIYAYAAGEVIESGSDPKSAGGAKKGKGNYVRIRHADGTVTEYFHMPNTPPVSVGQMVKAGQQIGAVGTTGASTGCHLHFGAFNSSGYLDPMTMTPPSGTPQPMTDAEKATLTQQITAIEAELGDLTEGGAAGDYVSGTDYCETGVSVGQKVIDCEQYQK